MGFLKRFFSKEPKNLMNNDKMSITLRQLKQQNIHILVEDESQLDMTFGEWLAYKKSNPQEPLKPQYNTIHMVVDEKVINGNDAQGVIEPLWRNVSIYDGEKQYEQDLLSFTKPQRYVFAIQWYVAEVNNGGHDQFYFNSTGIVWEDSLKGFEAIGACKNAEIVRESAKRMGGKPSKDREKRQNQMERLEPEFDDLDTMYYECEADMTELLHAYIRANAKDFMFSGEVRMLE